MALVEDWSVRLAREVAPGEEALAPMWAQAFVAGGEARRDLLASSRGMAGGFDAGSLASVLPVVLATVAKLAPLLLSAISSDTASEFIGVVRNAFSLMEVREERARKEAGRAKGAAAAQVLLVPLADPYAHLRRAADAMTRELRASGFAEERSEAIAFRVLRVMLEEPKDAARYVQTLAAAPPEAPGG